MLQEIKIKQNQCTENNPQNWNKCLQVIYLEKDLYPECIKNSVKNTTTKWAKIIDISQPLPWLK